MTAPHFKEELRHFATSPSVREGETHMGRKPKMRAVDPKIIAAMKQTVNARTKSALREQFGISYNTWTKLCTGLPVRESLAGRIEERHLHLISSSGNCSA